MKNTILQFYKKYSEIILSVAFVLSALLIFMQVTYPNVMTILATHEEINQEQSKLATYESSYRVLNNLNEQQIDNDVALATEALPSVKDPGSIYLAVVAATTNAGASLKGFTIQVGDILGKEPPVGNFPQKILVETKISGMDQEGFKAFVNSLLTELPVSTISQAKINEGDASITLNFYYMPYDLNIINAEVISPLSAPEQKTLNDIER